MDNQEPLDPEEQKKIKSLIEYISKVKDPADSKRVLAFPFKKLPTRADLPDYYEVIKDPVDINKIKKRHKNGHYKSVMELSEDFQLLIDNANTYNMDGSQISEDAKVLNEIFNKALSNIVEDGEIGEINLDDYVQDRIEEEPEQGEGAEDDEGEQQEEEE